MKTIIIALGNPILTDDGVGAKVIQELKNKREIIPQINSNDIELIELYRGGLSLMEAMIGYERAVIVDAMRSENEPGTISCCNIGKSGDQTGEKPLYSTKNLISTHDTNLSTALQMAELLNMPIPETINIWGIEVENAETFSEELTQSVNRAVPVLVDEIVSYLQKG